MKVVKKKLLVICGPTASGKTGLAIDLAKQFNGELVSADSRQVYKWMNIGTGKDVPDNSRWHLSKITTSDIEDKIGYWETKERIKIWGYDLVNPKQGFSAGIYMKFARNVFDDIWRRKKIVILVGGTGLYIKAAVDGIATAPIPKNMFLRDSLNDKNAPELYEILAQLDPLKAASMNISDRNNPRRLIRAIEIADSKIKLKDIEKGMNKFDIDNSYYVGLFASNKYLFKRIKERVKKRIDLGLEKEIEGLFKRKVTWDDQAMDSLGYKQWKGYYQGKKKRLEVIKEWEKEERRYVKRQMTWFRADKRINWFDVSKRYWKKDIEKSVKAWYSSK